MSSVRSSRPAFLIVALLLAAVVAALGGLSAARKVASFQTVGFTARGAGGLLVVTAVDDAATGLRPGDRIAFVQGREVPGLADLRHALLGASTSQLAVMRGDELVSVDYARPPLAIDWPYLVLALIGAVYLLIGFYTLLKDRSGQSRLFYLWCLASAALYLFTPGGDFDAAGRVLFAGDAVARLLLPPLTLHLFLVFPSPAVARRRLRHVLPFLYLPATFLLLVQADLVATGGRWLAGGRPRAVLPVLDRIELGHLVLYALAALAVLVTRLRRRDDWEQQRQMQWIAAGLAGGYVPFLLLYVVPLTAGLHWPEMATAAAVVPLGLVPLTFAYAILRYKLWDIDVIVRDTISYTLTLLLGVIGFSLVNLAIGRGVPPQLSLLRNLLVFATGLGIAGILVPAKRGISTGLERLQYRSTYGKRRALVDFGRDLLLERDLDRLCNRLLEAIEDSVGVVRGNLYLAEGTALVPVRPQAGLPPRLALDVLGEEVWGQEVQRIEGVALPAAVTLPAQRLFAAGYRYALPLTVRGNRVGLVLVGFKEDELRLSSDDLDLLRQLLDHAALAIENAQLLDQLQHRLEEVSRLQQYSEGIIESSPAGIAVLDPAGRVVSANLGFAAVVGRERGSLLGRPVTELLPVAPMPEPGKGPVETSFCDISGRERHLQLSASSFAGDGGTGRILVIHDVSEQVAMEAALKEQDRLAALGVMAAGVAHEVNTPLTGISSYAQMLLADMSEDDPRYALLKKVERQTFRASKIVNNLLDFARSRQGELGPVALAPVVGECLELLRERLAKRRIAVEWQPPDPGPVVIGDAGELQQVVTNLVLNAYDAMEENGGTLRLELGADGGRARLAVRDTGGGIAPELMGRIFEPFVTTKLGRGGTGLGLAISHDIVHHHGGELTVESPPGEGAWFTLVLPLAPDAAPQGGAGAETTR